MVVVSLASTKGGVGKTTTAICLATEWMRRGRQVGVVDADANQPLFRWLERAKFPHIGRSTADSDSILQRIREVGEGRDVVIVDLQGSANQAMLYAFGRSSLVLIPTQASNFDVVEAVKTCAIVQNAGELVGRSIPAHILFTKTPPMLQMRSVSHSRRAFEKRGLSLLQVELQERTALREMTYDGIPPNLTTASYTAARNLAALADEVEMLLGWRTAESPGTPVLGFTDPPAARTPTSTGSPASASAAS
jgi:chromosome partitioning protein